MEWVETTGRSVEEAKDAALDQLGVDEHDAEFVVLSEPRPGLFGRMRGEARVRARVRPTSPRPKQGRSRRSEQDHRGGRSRSGARQRADRTEGGTAVSLAEREGEEPAAAAAVAAGAKLKEPAARGSSSGPSSRTGSRSRTRRRTRSSSGRGRGPIKAEKAEEAERAGSSDESPGEGQAAPRHGKQLEPARARGKPIGSVEADDEEEEGVGEELSLEEQGETAREFVEGLVAMLGLGATVAMSVIDSDTVQISVDGLELGILIGPGGGTLVALQELARTVVQRRTGGRSERILVDVAGYRAKRAAALQRFTQKIADEVLSTGAERALEPMSASDRKVVHDTVNEIAGVGTRSVGEEPRRYIIIAPSAPVGSDPAETSDA